MGQLDGVKVIDLTKALAGPYCTMLLGDAGAGVVKIEPPGTGDEARSWGPPFVNGVSSYFLSINRNKRSIVLNLRTEEARQVLYKMVERADVLVENFKPGTPQRLGFGYDTISKINPKLVYCSISGFGQTGSFKDLPGYDIVAFAMSGIMSITGEQGRPPVKVGVPVADIGAGMFAALAIALSLYARGKTGKGEHIDVSLLDGQLSWLTYQSGYYFSSGKNPERLGSAHSTIAPYQAFRALDSYFVMAVANDATWKDFCSAIGRSDLTEHPDFKSNPNRVRNREKLEGILSQVFASAPSSYWIELLRKAEIPCGPINSVGEALTQPHVLERGAITELRHQKLGSLKIVANPMKLLNSSMVSRYPPPLLGEHTVEILTELDYSAAEIDALRQKKAIG